MTSNENHDRLERQLRAKLRSTCPPAQDLGEYQLGLLPDERRRTIREHLELCPHCEADLAQLTNFLVDDDSSVLTEIAEVVVAWGRGLLAGTGAPALAGVRGGAGRSRTFAAGILWLGVTVQERENGRFDLQALVTRADGRLVQQGTAWLTQADRDVAGGEIDRHGNLELLGLRPGEYDLGIQCDGTRVWVRGVTI